MKNEDMLHKIELANLDLKKNYEDKTHNLRSLCATYFARVENEVTTGRQRIEQVEKENERMEALFINPEKTVEAKLFTMS